MLILEEKTFSSWGTEACQAEKTSFHPWPHVFLGTYHLVQLPQRWAKKAVCRLGAAWRHMQGSSLHA